MKYNLNLTENYVAHWGLTEAIRELLANNIDESGTMSYSAQTQVNPTDRLSEIKFTTSRELPLDVFLLGYSVKANNHAIGQYGEGLKLAMLVLTRLHKIVLFKSGAYSYRFFFEIPEGFEVRTLHVEREELSGYEDENQPVVGTIISIFDVPRSVIEDQYTYAPLDSVIKNKHGLFCQGLMVEKDFYVRVENVEYGINLNTVVRGNRDRSYFPDKHLVCSIIERAFKPSQVLEISTSWYVGSIYEHMSLEYKQEIAKAWLIFKGISYNFDGLKNIRVLVPHNYGERYSRREGYIVAPYWGYGSYIMSEDDNKLLADMKIEETRLDTKDEREETRRQMVEQIYDDCKAATDIYDLISTLCNYLPSLNYMRDQAERKILEIAHNKSVAPKVLKPRKPKTTDGKN